MREEGRRGWRDGREWVKRGRGRGTEGGGGLESSKYASEKANEYKQLHVAKVAEVSFRSRL